MKQQSAVAVKWTNKQWRAYPAYLAAYYLTSSHSLTIIRVGVKWSSAPHFYSVHTHFKLTYTSCLSSHTTTDQLCHSHHLFRMHIMNGLLYQHHRSSEQLLSTLLPVAQGFVIVWCSSLWAVIKSFEMLLAMP